MDSAIQRSRAMNKTFVVLAMLAALLVLGVFATSASAHQNDPCRLTLTPETADNPLNTSHTVTATVTRKGGFFNGDVSQPGSFAYSCANSVNGGGEPLAGVTVNFVILTGPNAGQTGSAVTDANGKATFTWIGATPGTDTVQASLTYSYTDGDCEQYQQPTAFNNECEEITKTDTLTTTAVKNWIPPQTPPVIQQAAPKTTLALAKHCQSKKFRIRSGYQGLAATKAVLVIDGKTVKTVTINTGKPGSTTFTVDSGKYKSGRHSIKVITTFADGTTLTTKGKFSRCAVRTATHRVSPQFTG